MNWPTRVIAFCLTSCVCLTDAKCWTWPTVRDRSKTQEKCGTIFSATKTTENAITVILPACLIRKSGRRFRRANKNCATQSRAIPSYDRPPTLTIGSKKRRLRSPKNAPLYNYLEQERPIPVGYRGRRALFGNLFKYARLLLRAVDERAKPNGERIPQFRDSAHESPELELFRASPFTAITRSCARPNH